MQRERIRRSAIFLLLSLALSGRAAPAQLCNSPASVDVRQTIQSKYHDREVDDIDQMSPSYPPNDVIRELGTLGFAVTPYESRELDEVSRSYSVKRGKPGWRLCISGVGRYVALFRLNKDDRDDRERLESLTDNTPRKTPDDLKLIRYVKSLKHPNNQNYTLLDRAILKCNSGLRRVGPIEATNAEPIVYWQALFRWERADWL